MIKFTLRFTALLILAGLFVVAPCQAKDKNKNHKKTNYYEKAAKKNEVKRYLGPKPTKSQRNEAAAADIIRVEDIVERAKYRK